MIAGKSCAGVRAAEVPLLIFGLPGWGKRTNVWRSVTSLGQGAKRLTIDRDDKGPLRPSKAGKLETVITSTCHYLDDERGPTEPAPRVAGVASINHEGRRYPTTASAAARRSSRITYLVPRLEIATPNGHKYHAQPFATADDAVAEATRGRSDR